MMTQKIGGVLFLAGLAVSVFGTEAVSLPQAPQRIIPMDDAAPRHMLLTKNQPGKSKHAGKVDIKRKPAARMRRLKPPSAPAHKAKMLPR